jgi:energy-coupling factor transporter transmembrane protein EcfT
MGHDKKVTPIHDLSWYIKWISTLIIVVGSYLNSNNVFPLNIYVMLVGISGWLIVGYLWKDRAMLVLNTIIICFYLFAVL